MSILRVFKPSLSTKVSFLLSVTILLGSMLMFSDADADELPRLERRYMVINMPNDTDCAVAYSIAEEQGKAGSYGDKYRLVGLYFVSEGYCQVFNIMYLENEKTYPHSAHEILEMIFDAMIINKYLASYESIENGKVFRLK